MNGFSSQHHGATCLFEVENGIFTKTAQYYRRHTGMGWNRFVKLQDGTLGLQVDKITDLVYNRGKHVVNKSEPGQVITKFKNVLNKRFKVFAKKNIDYGSSFDVDGIVGIVIRLGDKFMRLKTISNDKHMIQVSEEGMKELLSDIANYCDIGIMLLEDKDE